MVLKDGTWALGEQGKSVTVAIIEKSWEGASG